jgi:hypothetical protein
LIWSTGQIDGLLDSPERARDDDGGAPRQRVARLLRAWYDMRVSQRQAASEIPVGIPNSFISTCLVRPPAQQEDVPACEVEEVPPVLKSKSRIAINVMGVLDRMNESGAASLPSLMDAISAHLW